MLGPPNLSESSPVRQPLSRITRGKKSKPRRACIYGQHGVGKSTFAATSEAPVIIPVEDGLNDIDVPSFPLATSYTEILRNIGELYTESHDFKTAAIDSLDWMERLVHRQVCDDRKVSAIEDIGYGKGYGYAIPYWQEILAGLDALRNDRGMSVILIAHADIQKFQNPETDTYDRYVPRLHKLASALVCEWCDEILFATYKVFTRKAEENFGKSTYKAIGTGERVLKTTERPAYLAKNRLNLPDEIPLNAEIYAKHVRGEMI